MSIESFPVEKPHILFFARSIGDENPSFTDYHDVETGDLVVTARMVSVTTEQPAESRP
jgi:hypothetical protein